MTTAWIDIAQLPDDGVPEDRAKTPRAEQLA
jgi:hypothetical protein